jgi:Ca2+-transporting ATPase
LPELGLFSNAWLFAAFLTSGLLQLAVLTLPLASGFFKVSPIQTIPWLMVIGLSLLPATVIELSKIAWHFFGLSNIRKDKLLPRDAYPKLNGPL